ncbi:MAG: hypothetical protein JW726_00160 [Anaerolineales bacterium]|nr:hypothetical protein [Anaerolineales bacterium]
MHSYVCYGQRLGAAEDLSDYLIPSLDPPTIEYSICQSVHLADSAPGELVYSSQSLDEASHEPVIRIWRQERLLRVRIPVCGVYDLEPAAITFYPFAHTEAAMQWLCLMGTIMSLWLEWTGRLALHASAVVIDQHAIGFLSHSQAGKSTLVATFLQAGFSFLTDDILALEVEDQAFLGQFSYPWIKLWPAEAHYFLNDRADRVQAHPLSDKQMVRVGEGGYGSFSIQPKPIACLYIPQRVEAGKGEQPIQILPLSPKDAAVELIRYSFSGPLLRAVGVESARLGRISALAQKVPVRRLIYPAGFEHLPEVREVLISDTNIQ